MKLSLFLFLSFACATGALADAPDLSKVSTQADLDAAIATTTDAALKQALKDHSAAILAAAAEHAHAEVITTIVTAAKGKVEKINTTPEPLKKAAGGELTLFDTLKLVDLSVPNAGPHDHRTNDPYDAAFFEHLGHLTAIESLNIISTKLGDEWIAPIGKLTTLKVLKFTNNGRLTDAGMEKLAGLTNLEQFSFVGTYMQGHAYAKMTGWTKITRVSHRGNKIDDEGIKELCDHLPNLESISLAHAKFTDAGAVHLAKLKKLKGLELGLASGTPAALNNLTALPLEYLQLGDGLDSPEGIAVLKNIPTLKRVTLTGAARLDDAGLALAADLKQLEQLEIGGLQLPDERLPKLAAFSFLKELKLINRPKGYPAETQAKVKALLPKTDVKFQ